MTEIIAGVALVVLLGVAEVFLITRFREERDRRAVVRWLTANTQDEPGASHVGTFELAQALGMSEDRVRSACTSSPAVHHVGGSREQWTVWPKDGEGGHDKRSVLPA